MSKDTKLFTVAGVSTFRGAVTFRFCNGKARNRRLVLTRNGHVDIDLFDLPQPMTKLQAVAYLEAEGHEAVLPKTGRGSGLTQEQVAKHEELLTERAKHVEATQAEVHEADAAFISSLTTKPAE